MEIWVSIFIGFALATATGFRVFLPLLLLSFSSFIGLIHLSSDMSWLGTSTACIVLGIATVIELICYLVPGADNLMDIIDTPVAIVAGILIMSSVIETDPFMQWSLSIIIGGSITAVLKFFKASLRAMLTILTGGFGNVFFAVFEAMISLGIVILAIILLVQ